MLVVSAGIIEALLLAIVGFLVMFWRWRTLKQERKVLEISWRALRKITEEDIVALEIPHVAAVSNPRENAGHNKNDETYNYNNDREVLEEGQEPEVETEVEPEVEAEAKSLGGAPSVAILVSESKLRFLKAMMEMFGKSLSNGIKSWNQSRDAIFLVFSQLEEDLIRVTEKNFQFALEDENLKSPTFIETQETFLDDAPLSVDDDSAILPAQLEVLVPVPKEEYIEVPTLLEEQGTGAAALHDYKEDLNKLVTKSQALTMVNHKLLEQIKLLAEKNKEVDAVRQMFDLAQQNTHQLEAMVADLEHQKSRLEPKIAMFEQENQQLVVAMNHYRQRIKTLTQQINDNLQEKISLKAAHHESETKLTARTRSYWHLRKEFDTLRRKYMMIVKPSR
ncbi:hypothetical protein CCP3SC1_570001 [Gammaproteobacteria bacterium]